MPRHRGLVCSAGAPPDLVSGTFADEVCAVLTKSTDGLGVPQGWDGLDLFAGHIPLALGHLDDRTTHWSLSQALSRKSRAARSSSSARSTRSLR